MISVRQADDSIFSAPFEKAYQILIDAYARSEMEIWGENYARISKEEYSSLIRNGEVYFAFLAEEVVGCIQVFRLNTSSYSFGLLAVDELENGLGIGRELIRTAEQLALTNG
ncbi:MAG: GNAT family N-acetyltransferase, partial [Flavobacteriales bacterium]